MRSAGFGSGLALALGLGIAGGALLAAPVAAAELYLAGNIGISSIEGEGEGVNTFVGRASAGSSDDASPVYGTALGLAASLSELVPWGLRLPGFALPYAPGRRLRFRGSEDFRMPDWDVRAEVEYLRGRDVELATAGFTAGDPFRADLSAWSVMGKLRLDVPVRTPVNAIVGRVPFLDPLTLYVGGGAGLAATDLDVNQGGLLFGSERERQLAWEAGAGLGYRLNPRVLWSAGWRYQDLGKVSTRLVDVTQTDRGSYRIELAAHEFTTSLTFAFWRFPFLGE